MIETVTITEPRTAAVLLPGETVAIEGQPIADLIEVGTVDTIATVEVEAVVVEQPGGVLVITDAPSPTVIELGVAGPQGPPGSAGSAPQAYDHEQQVPSTVWTIDHMLGYRPGGVLVVDSAGSVNMGQIEHPTMDQTVLTFSAAFSGHAYLS